MIIRTGSYVRHKTMNHDYVCVFLFKRFNPIYAGRDYFMIAFIRDGVGFPYSVLPRSYEYCRDLEATYVHQRYPLSLYLNVFATHRLYTHFGTTDELVGHNDRDADYGHVYRNDKVEYSIDLQDR